MTNMEINKNNSVRIAAVGDICLGDHPLIYGNGVRTKLASFGNTMFAPLMEHQNRWHVLLGNLECVLSDLNMDDRLESRIFRGKPEFSKILSEVGFNVLNIANNHSLQHGKDAFLDTIQILNTAKIDVIGRYTENKFKQLIVKNINNIKIGFLGVSFADDSYFRQGGYEKLSYTDDFSHIAVMKSEVDYLVVSCHWGIEDINRPPIEVIETARRLCDLGVDIIFGHHPHVFQAIEKWGDSLIFYSLGNFIFDCIWTDELSESAIVEVNITSKGISYNLLPVKIKKDLSISLMQGEAKESYLHHVKTISERAYYDNYEGDKVSQIDCFKQEYINIERRLQLNKIKYLLNNIFFINKETYGYLLFKLKQKLLKCR